MLSRKQFEQLVIEALDDLPTFFHEKMNNVELLIERWPSAAALKRAAVPPGRSLMGLYQGIPLTRRSHAYTLVPPDTIILFQGPIEAAAGNNRAQIRQAVRRTVIHEIAHHFGISDERLKELDAY